MAATSAQPYALLPAGCSSSSQRSAKSAMVAGGNVNAQKLGAEAQPAIERQQGDLRDLDQRGVAAQPEEQQVRRAGMDERNRRCRQRPRDASSIAIVGSRARRERRPEEQPVERHRAEETQVAMPTPKKSSAMLCKPTVAAAPAPTNPIPIPGRKNAGPKVFCSEPARQPLAGEQAAHEQPDDEEGDHDRVCRARCVPLEHSLGEHIRGHHRGGEERADGRRRARRRGSVEDLAGGTRRSGRPRRQRRGPRAHRRPRQARPNDAPANVHSAASPASPSGMPKRFGGIRTTPLMPWRRERARTAPTLSV